MFHKIMDNQLPITDMSGNVQHFTRTVSMTEKLTLLLFCKKIAKLDHITSGRRFVHNDKNGIVMDIEFLGIDEVVRSNNFCCFKSNSIPLDRVRKS